MSGAISGAGAQQVQHTAPVEAPEPAPAPAPAEQVEAGPASAAQTTARAPSVGMSVAALQARLQVDGHGTGLDLPPGGGKTVDGHGMGLDLPAAPSPAKKPEGYGLLDAARAGQYLRSGSSGESVKALQRALKQAGADVPESGAYDAKTLAAVKKFQQENGCAVDGVVGPETLGALDRKLGISGTPGGGSGGGSTPAVPGGGPARPQDAPQPPSGPPGAPTTPGAPTGPEGPTGPSGPQPSTPSAPAGGLEALPARPADAMTGSQFMAKTAGMSRADREKAILEEIDKGNVPDFLRDMKPVTVNFQGADGKQHTATYKVLPDYLAVGSNDDFVRMPMSPLTAQKIADKLGCSLPTSKMVDDIYAAADKKLAPSPQPAGPQMMSNDYYARHQATIEKQLGGDHSGLIAGDKKDLVLSNKLEQKPGSVAIYGWHQPNGKPIQPTSTVHENTYADYSHGTRLVAGTVMVDGKPMALADALRDPNISKGLSNEGPLRVTRQPGV